MKQVCRCVYKLNVKVTLQRLFKIGPVLLAPNQRTTIPPDIPISKDCTRHTPITHLILKNLDTFFAGKHRTPNTVSVHNIASALSVVEC